MKFLLRFLPLAFLAATVPFMSGLDACAALVGLCDFETDANCEDPVRAQVLGTIAVPEAGGEMVGGAGQGLRRIDGPLAFNQTLQ